jgi:GTPase
MATPAHIIDPNLPTVALVGRVNVGKSTLFNKLTEQDKALISKVPGTTRTRNIGLVRWGGKQFRIIDTGGLTFSDDVLLEEDIIKQTEIAIKEADLILFVADIKEGLLPQEKELAQQLRKSKKKIFFVVNKADGLKHEILALDKEWKKMQLGEPLPISAASGNNLGELLDKILKELRRLPRRPKNLKEVRPIKVALVGRPNVGKSSLFNKLIGEERVVVSNMPHTTREPHDTLVKLGPDLILFVDTAGIRRKAKVKGELEKKGIAKSIEAAERADVVLLLLDTNDPISDQDKQLAGLLREHAKSVIIIVNKWDLAEENTDQMRNQAIKDIGALLPHLNFAPIVFVSAKSGYRTHQIFPLIKKAWLGRRTEVNEDKLEEFFAKAKRYKLPSKGKGTNFPKLLDLTQLATDPPIFDIRVKAKTSLHQSYINYLSNGLRREFGFFACPIVMKVSKQKK